MEKSEKGDFPSQKFQIFGSQRQGNASKPNKSLFRYFKSPDVSSFRSELIEKSENASEDT